MRFLLLLAAIMGSAQIYGQSFSDPKYSNTNAELPRTQIIIGDKEGADQHTSKFTTLIGEWAHPGANKNIFESKFSRPFSWIGRQLYLRVGAASAPYTLFVNDKEVGTIQNSSQPAEFNITKATKEGRNIVTINFETTSNVDEIEGWKPVTSSPTIEGVYVATQPTQMIRDLKIESETMGETLNSQISLIIKSYALSPRTSTVHYTLRRKDGEIVTFGKRDITQSMRGEDTLSFNAKIPLSEGWSDESPTLFNLTLSIQHEGRYLEYQDHKIGFRTIEHNPTNGELSVNGTPVTLRAKIVSPNDIDIATLKTKGYNTIKIEGGTPSLKLYEECDKEGIYVIATAPINSSSASQNITKGGNPSNDPAWWGGYIERIDATYHTSQIHPSVIAFCIADSSLNGYNLYEGYLRFKQKESSRPVVYFDADGEWNSDKLDINLK